MSYFEYTKSDLDMAYQAGYDDGKEAADVSLFNANEQIEDLKTQVSNLKNIVEDAKNLAHQLWHDLGNA